MIKIKKKKALELLNEQKDKSVNLVLTDPPYNVDLDYDEYQDNLEKEEYWNWIKTIIEEIQRVLTEEGAAIFITPANQMKDWLEIIEESSLEIFGKHFWMRSNMVGGNNTETIYDSATYPMYVLHKGGHELRNPAGNEFTSRNYLETAIPQSNFSEERFHPAQQPVELYEKMVYKHTDRGDLVVDPFLGSGTTAVASKRKGRDFIGCEISEEYVSKARERLRSVNSEKVFRQISLD